MGFRYEKAFFFSELIGLVGILPTPLPIDYE